MQKLNAQKQSLETRQRETIQKKQEIGFQSLSSETKKYACLLYLANVCIKNGDFSIKDGQEEVEEYQFKSSQSASDFREISDYVDYIFSTRESKITKPEDVLNIIRADAKSLDIEFEKPNTEKIKNIYQKVLDRVAKENNKKISEKEQIELSQIGIEPVRDFGDGMVMYRLMPDTEYYKEHGEHRNLVYEGNQMGLCIGQKGQAYSQNILDLDKNQYYTLRSKEKNGQLVPHCTIEVNGITVNQVKGNSNGPVNGDYIKQVREFLKNDLNCIFPGEKSQDGKRQLWDYANIGFVRDINDRTVDIFKLPPNTWFNVFYYTLYKLKGVDIENIRTINTLFCSEYTLTQKEYDNLRKIRNIKKISFTEAKLKGIFEFKDLKNVYLTDTDLSEVTEIKFANIDYINLSGYKLKGKLDFSGVKELSLEGADLSEVTEIKFNPNAEWINLARCKGLKGKLDFSRVKELKLSDTDLSEVTEIKFNPKGKVWGWYLEQKLKMATRAVINKFKPKPKIVSKDRENG